ncbi:hypothetical protein ACLB2K_066542 [Fragaria x ananassa]
MDTRVKKLENHGKASATNTTEKGEIDVEDNNNIDKDEPVQDKQSLGDWVKDFLESSGEHNKVDTAGDITKKIKVDVLDFEGRTDPTVFSNWLARIEEYFDWYDDERQVRFAKMKLVLLAKVGWASIENDIRRLGQHPINYWQEMKAKLREKYMPSNYLDKLCDQLTAHRKGDTAVSEYMQKFDELKTRSQIVEDPRQTLARFKVGLRPDIRREMIRHPVYSLEHAFQVALDLEEYLGYTKVKKFGGQGNEVVQKKNFEITSKVWPGTTPLFNRTQDSKPSSSKTAESRTCFKCGLAGHMGYQCPQKNLHMGKEQEEEAEQQTVDTGFDYGEYVDDDLEEEGLDTWLISVVRRILAVPKVEEEDCR